MDAQDVARASARQSRRLPQRRTLDPLDVDAIEQHRQLRRVEHRGPRAWLDGRDPKPSLLEPFVQQKKSAPMPHQNLIALARHNYLFFGHPRAGRNFAGLYSLVGSCVANNVEPTEYLTDVLPRIRDATTDEQLDALLPDRWQPLGPAP